MSTRFLLTDACVLIDYAITDRSVLATVSTAVAPIAVVRRVLQEVDQLSLEDAEALGIAVIDVDFEIAAAAAADNRTALSFQDRLCLAVAQQQRWTCVTNDGALRRACSSEGVPVLWGLEMMVEAVAVGAMTPADAIEVAEAIGKTNRRFITPTILAGFKRKVRR